jgi:hypothetical protein
MYSHCRQTTNLSSKENTPHDFIEKKRHTINILEWRFNTFVNRHFFQHLCEPARSSDLAFFYGAAPLLSQRSDLASATPSVLNSPYS